VRDAAGNGERHAQRKRWSTQWRQSRMPLVESHIITPPDPYDAAIDAACGASKHRSNAAVDEVRQAGRCRGVSLNDTEREKRMPSQDADTAFPANVAHQVMAVLDTTWHSWVAASTPWREHPERFCGRPMVPPDTDTGKGAPPPDLSYSGRMSHGTHERSGHTIAPHHRGGEPLPRGRRVPPTGVSVGAVVSEQDGKHEPVQTDRSAGRDLGITPLATRPSHTDGSVPNGNARVRTSRPHATGQRVERGSPPRAHARSITRCTLRPDASVTCWETRTVARWCVAPPRSGRTRSPEGRARPRTG
jgi:hypothetical protein